MDVRRRERGGSLSLETLYRGDKDRRELERSGRRLGEEEKSDEVMGVTDRPLGRVDFALQTH